MAFNVSNTPTEDDLWDEQVRQELREMYAGIPRALRLLVRQPHIYSIDAFVADTIAIAPEHSDLIRSCSPEPHTRCDDADLARARIRLALALENAESDAHADLALGWRLLGGTITSAAMLRYDLGSRIVSAFDRFVDSGRAQGIGLQLACDLMLSVAGWSVACHRGLPTLNVIGRTNWLLPASANVAETLAETGAMHPKSAVKKAYWELLGEFRDLEERYKRLAVDKSLPDRDISREVDFEFDPSKPRTLH